MSELPAERPSGSFDPRAGAARLAAAWRKRTRLAELPPEERPADVAQAYALQAALQQAMGDGSVGWKIAGGSVNGLKASPHGAPLFGFLREPCVHPSGAVLAAPPASAVFTLEVEVALRFGRAAAPAEEPFDPAGMLDAAFLAVEVVCSRFVDRKAVGVPSFIGDDAGFHAFILGDPLPLGAASPLLGEPATLWHHDEQVGPALAGDDRTDPLQSMALFWRHAAQQRWSVPAGAIVSTGTLIKPWDTAGPGTYEGRLGAARVVFSIADIAV
ncbi:hydratase [Aquincola sp. MAHUQ-54]|uniref:Hydratase n=1 Tax=Aquincola agrisoli TaxID=3119538 RepID=A0AAW9Q8U9_9BURK